MARGPLTAAGRFESSMGQLSLRVDDSAVPFDIVRTFGRGEVETSNKKRVTFYL